MRFVSIWRFIAILGFVFAATLPTFRSYGEESWTNWAATSPQPDNDDAPSPPATLQKQVSAAPSQPAAALRPAAAPTPRPFPRATVPVVTQSFVEPQLTNQTRQALGFYGGYSARATLSQLPRRASIQSSGLPPARRQAKPFSSIQTDPTISPYLNLDRDDENLETIPSYFAFVRPQFDQIETNRKQQREIQQLRGQLQGMSSTLAGPQYHSGGLPSTGTASRYMDTAQFYGGWRR